MHELWWNTVRNIPCPTHPVNTNSKYIWFKFICSSKSNCLSVTRHLICYSRASLLRQENNKVCTSNWSDSLFQAPGVAENRPSVLRGDHLFVNLVEGQPKYQGPFYKGYVHAVEWDQVKLGFSDKWVLQLHPMVRFFLWEQR